MRKQIKITVIFFLLVLFSTPATSQTQGSLAWNSDIGVEGFSWSTPIVINNSLYMQDQEGGIGCYNATTGTRTWYVKIADEYPVTSPVYNNEKLYMFAGDTVYRINPLDGIIEKQFSVEGKYPGPGAPAVTDTTMFFTTSDTVYAIDTVGFTQKWSKTIRAKDLIVTGNILLVMSDKLYALNTSDGSEIWNLAAPAGDDGFDQAGLSGTNLAVYTYSGYYSSTLYLYQLSSANDTAPALIWSNVMTENYQAHSPPTIASGTVLSTSREGVLKAYSVTDSTSLWEREIRESGYAPAMPIAVDGKVYVQDEIMGSSSRKNSPLEVVVPVLVCLDITTGALDWNSSASDNMGISWGQPAAANNIIYVATDHAKGLFAYHAGTLNNSWYMFKHNPSLTGSDNDWEPSVSDSDCPAERLLGRNAPELNILRHYRDKVLAKSNLGKDMIGYYYKNSDAVNKIIDENPTIKITAQTLLAGILPFITLVSQ